MPARLPDLLAFPLELLLVDHLLLRPGLLQFLQPPLTAFQKPYGVAGLLFELLQGVRWLQQSGPQDEGFYRVCFMPAGHGLRALVHLLGFPVDGAPGFPPGVGVRIPSVLLPDRPRLLHLWNVLGGQVLPAIEDGFLSAPGFPLEGLLNPLQGFLQFGLSQAQGGCLLALGEFRPHFANVQ